MTIQETLLRDSQVAPIPSPSSASRAAALAGTHAAIWWLHDAADYAGVEAAAQELIALALPACRDGQVIAGGAAIRACYEAYDAAQACVRAWEFADYPHHLARLRNAHRAAREAWCPEPTAPDMEEGYFAFFHHSMWLHTPGLRRPLQKCWRNPARLAGIWRYHRAAFGSTHRSAVVPAVRCLFWAGLQGHDYKSRPAAEGWLEEYWTLLQARGIAHLFF